MFHLKAETQAAVMDRTGNPAQAVGLLGHHAGSGELIVNYAV